MRNAPPTPLRAGRHVREEGVEEVGPEAGVPDAAEEEAEGVDADKAEGPGVRGGGGEAGVDTDEALTREGRPGRRPPDLCVCLPETFDGEHPPEGDVPQDGCLYPPDGETSGPRRRLCRRRR